MRRGSTLIALLVLAGCAEGETEAGGPRVTALSASAVVVGETMEFYGQDFLHGKGGTTRLRFVGRFLADDGSAEPVDLTITPAFGGVEEAGDQRQVLLWSRVGPFANPFTGDARHGRFEGDIVPETEAADGVVTRGHALKAQLAIGPSVIIEAFQPLDAECGAPALRALQGLAYTLRVRTSGIKATRFVYELNNINGAEGVTRFEHDFGTGNPVAADVLGVDEPVLFNPVGPADQFYVSAIRVLAYDDDGHVVETALPLTVHRGMEVVYDGNYEIAEIYQPVPVSGCIPGSIGTSVTYQETQTETRQQSVSVTVSTSWARSQGRALSQSMLEGISTGETRSRELSNSEWEGETASEGYNVDYTQSQANEMSFSSSDGETWEWSVDEEVTNEAYAERMNELYGEGSWSGTVGAKAEGSIPGFAKVSGSVETTVGVTAGASTAATQGQRRSQSQRRGYRAGGSHDETRSFGSTTAESRSQSISGEYALSNNRQRTQSDAQARSSSRTWSFSESASQEDVVSEGQTDAEALTWSSSESISRSQSFTGLIPRNKVGIFYRQTTRFVRRAEVRSYDLCGLANHVGELQFSEWRWAPDLAIGPSCETTPPPPALPAARCFIPPCGG